MNDRPRISDTIQKGLSAFTLQNTLWMIATIIVCVAFFVLSLCVEGEEALLIAPWWMRIVQGLFIAVAVLLAFPLAKHLPTTTSRITGQPSRTVMFPYIVLVYTCLCSHALIWGGLHHLHPGQPTTLRGKVLNSGRRHGKGSQGHGDWVDLQLDGQTKKTHLESAAMDAISSNDAPRPYLCELQDTRPGDDLELQGFRSTFGFAVSDFVPLNERLLAACDTSRPNRAF